MYFQAGTNAPLLPIDKGGKRPGQTNDAVVTQLIPRCRFDVCKHTLMWG